MGCPLKNDPLLQSSTQASSRYPSYQMRLGTECDSANELELEYSSRNPESY